MWKQKRMLIAYTHAVIQPRNEKPACFIVDAFQSSGHGKINPISDCSISHEICTYIHVSVCINLSIQGYSACNLLDLHIQHMR